MKKTFVYYFAGLAAVMIAGAISFAKLGGGMFFSWDSSSYIAFANESLANGIPFHLGPSYNQSLGNITHPVDFWLLPEAVFSFHDGKIDPARFYLIVAALFYTCAYVMAIVFGLGRWIALVSAGAFVLLTLPYSSPVAFTELFWWHAPFMIPTVYMAFALLLPYFLAGRLRGAWNLVPAVVFAAAVFWTVAGYPKLSATIFLGAAVFCAVFTVAVESRRELAWKLASAALAAAVAIVVGPWEFIRGVYGYTGNSLFNLETLTVGGGLDWRALLSSLFHHPDIWLAMVGPNFVWVKYHMGYVLPALALLGAAWTLASSLWGRPAKLLAAGLLLTFPYAFVSIYASAYPAQVYYLLFAFALVPVADVARRSAGRLPPLPFALPRALEGRKEQAALVAVALMLLVVGAKLPKTRPNGYPYPPASVPLAEHLKSQIAFGQGGEFRGRYLSLLLAETLDRGEFAPISNTTAMAVAVSGYRIAEKEGNDLTFASLRELDVPVTIEYNRMTNPLSVVFLNLLLVRPGDRERIDYRTITRFDPKLLAMLGVRYVLMDRVPQRDGTVKVAMEQALRSRPEVGLVELPSYNRGQYSPTELTFSAGIVDALDAISRPDFDPLSRAIVHEPAVARDLVPARSTRITRIRNGLRIAARSDGLSYLVLPFEFSRCLRVDSPNGKAPLSVARANLILTGVLFDREADFDVSLDFGPFSNQDCRLRDLADAKALGLNSDAIATLRQRHPSKLVFDGLQ